MNTFHMDVGKWIKSAYVQKTPVGEGGGVGEVVAGELGLQRRLPYSSRAAPILIASCHINGNESSVSCRTCE